MATDITTDVIISGAGASGLTVALELARRSIPFILIDKIGAPFPGSRGKALQPRTLEIFEDFGVVNRVIKSGGFYPLARAYKGEEVIDSVIMDRNEPTDAEPYRTTIMVPQFATERILRERLAEYGAHVHFETELLSFTQDEGGVSVKVHETGQDRNIRARYLIGADGGRSIIRHHLAIDFPGETLGLRGLVADLIVEGLDSEFWHRWNAGKPTQMSLCPLRGTELFQLQATIPADGPDDLSLDALTKMIVERTGRSDLQVKEVKWASTFRNHARLADHYRSKRVFLVGDAGHVHPPTGGQGLNTSIQDAYNLGWKLAAVLSGADDQLLDSYEAERRPIAAGMLGLATDLFKAAKQGDLRRGRDVQQLDLAYADSPLSLEKPVRGAGLRSGARAPNATCRLASGSSVRLFDLFKGPHWTLLGYGCPKPSDLASSNSVRVYTIGPDGDVIDDANFIATTYGLSSGEWVLVRPDKYIAAFVACNDFGEIKKMLARSGISEAAA